MFDIPWSTISDFTGWTFTGIFVLLTFFGIVVSRRTLRDAVNAQKDRIKDKDDTLSYERARNDVLEAALRDLQSHAETTDKILQAWYRVYQRTDQDWDRGKS